MTQRAERLYTVAEFEQKPEYGERYELINGVIVKKPVPNIPHGRITRRLINTYYDFDPGEEKGELISEVTVRIRDNHAPVPDLSYWVKGRQLIETQTAPRPDLAIEIQSEGQSLSSLTGKARGYLKAGVQIVWIIQPTKRIVLVYHQGSISPITIPPTGVLDGGEVIPGFKIALAKLFG